MNMQEVKQLIYEGEKVNIECKRAENSVPKSVYESYSGFANTNGGYIFLGVKENKDKMQPQERFTIQGINNSEQQKTDFWNTINSGKVNVNILRDEDVSIIKEDDISIIVIHVPRADYKMRPVYVGENPYKGAYKRNNEGDYHMSEHEINAMIRDKNPDGSDSMILEGYTVEDIDSMTLRQYRQQFQVRNPEHVWNSLNDKQFLECLGGYRKDRVTGMEGLTLAGLLMFGKGLPIRDKFDNIFMDFRDESQKTTEIRWNDRVTYDGTWENNLFNFFVKVTRKLTADLIKPFALKNSERIDDTPVHKAIREAFVNLIIHADYLADAGILKIIKLADGYEFTNPGILKLPINEIMKGGNSKPRNPRMQTMLRMVGFGDNAGSGFPTILRVWGKEGWIEPQLYEDICLNQVTLSLKMTPKWQVYLEYIRNLLEEKVILSPEIEQAFREVFIFDKLGCSNVMDLKIEDIANRMTIKLCSIPGLSTEDIVNALVEIKSNIFSGYLKKDELIMISNSLAKKVSRSAEKSAESAEKSAEKKLSLSKRQMQILSEMKVDNEYSADEIALLVKLKGPRTRQLLKELISIGEIEAIGTTKGRRYVKVSKKESSIL